MADGQAIAGHEYHADSRRDRQTTQVVHLFTFSVDPSSAPIRAVSNAKQAHKGRYAMHVKAAGGVRQVGRNALVEVGMGCERGRAAEASVLLDDLGNVQFRLAADVPGGTRQTAQHLRDWCRCREDLFIDGQPILTWVAKALGSPVVKWEPDVLQITLLSDRVARALRNDYNKSRLDALVRLVYRSPDGKYRKSTGTMVLPRELTRDAHQLGAHGRGVFVLGGHSRDLENAVELVASDLLLAVARVRGIRAKVEETLLGLGESSNLATYRHLDGLVELSNGVRDARVSLAVGVRLFADGLFLPEIILDNVRSGLRATLRLDDFIDTTTAALDTLAAVVETRRQEVEGLRDQERQNRQRRWAVFASLATALVVPLGLVLAFFGVSSEATVPNDVSIWSREYALIWGVGAAVSVLLVLITLRPIFRRGDD